MKDIRCLEFRLGLAPIRHPRQSPRAPGARAPPPEQSTSQPPPEHPCQSRSRKPRDFGWVFWVINSVHKKALLTRPGAEVGVPPFWAGRARPPEHQHKALGPHQSTLRLHTGTPDREGVTVRALPARPRLLEERAHRARRLRGAFGRRLRLRLSLGLGLGRTFLAASLAALASAAPCRGNMGRSRPSDSFRGPGSGSRFYLQLLLSRHPSRRTGRQGTVPGRRACLGRGFRGSLQLLLCALARAAAEGCRVATSQAARAREGRVPRQSPPTWPNSSARSEAFVVSMSSCGRLRRAIPSSGNQLRILAFTGGFPGEEDRLPHLPPLPPPLLLLLPHRGGTP